MFRSIVIFMLSLLQGSSQIAKYYIPEASAEQVRLHPGGGCTGPDATFTFNVTPDVVGFVSAGVGDDGWGLYYGFSVSKGSKIQVINPVFKIRDIDSGNEFDVPMEAFRLSIYGGLPDRPAGYHQTYDAGAELIYTGLNEPLNVDHLRRDSFQSAIHLTGRNPSAFELTIPKLVANGIAIEPIRVFFRYAEIKYINYCVQ